MASKPIHILGFNCFAHDAAASIIRDGEHLGLVEEERFLHKKHVGDFPRHSINWCCDIAGIKPAELDHIVYYWDPKLARGARLWHLLRYFPRSLALVKNRWGKETPMLRLRQTLTEELGLDWGRTKLHFAEHHLCHAASSFLTSKFDKAAILTIDAAGEWDCTWLGYGDGLDLHRIKTQSFPHSIGLVYGAVTEFLGQKFASGEGKVMGLAPYGSPDPYIDEFRKIIRLKPDGEYDVDLSYFEYHIKGRPNWFTPKFYKAFGEGYSTNNHPDQRAMDIAAALQLRTEEVGLHMAEWLRKKTGLNKICLAGGVCLNSVMNGRILLDLGFEEVVVQPAANDAGTAMGGCYWLWNTVMRQPRNYVFDHAYFGPWWTNEQIEPAIHAKLAAGAEGDYAGGADANDRVEWQKVEDAPKLAAQMLADGKIIGWFQDRMEMGPRALGNRSILADPRRDEMKDIINARVKFREGYRPFAPSVLEDKTGQYFETNYPSPYMILVYDVLPDKKDVIPAVTHVDGTGRVQSVSREHNPKYYRLIEEFEKLTGVAVVLNTSFNIRGKPIVHTPQDAIECFMTTGMDALFIGDYLLTKKTTSAAKEFTDEQLEVIHAAAMAEDSAE
ncbi:MAG: carbamoyltransferase C-terminal domain-containing protein [Phycisphaeraceae bacterium]